jgi:hypothetical protein
MGRVPTDSPGTLSGPLTLVDGSGVQVSSFKRWGDYSSMSVDPSDDCTLWYTNEYYATTGSVNWALVLGRLSSIPARRTVNSASCCLSVRFFGSIWEVLCPTRHGRRYSEPLWLKPIPSN